MKRSLIYLCLTVLLALVLSVPFTSTEAKLNYLATPVKISVLSGQYADSAAWNLDRQSYIVALKSHANADMAASYAHQLGAEVRHTYRSALQGFAAHMTEAAATALRRRPDLAYVEPDAAVSVFAQIVPAGVTRIAAPLHPYFHEATDIDIAIIDTGIETNR